MAFVHLGLKTIAATNLARVLLVPRGRWKLVCAAAKVGKTRHHVAVGPLRSPNRAIVHSVSRALLNQSIARPGVAAWAMRSRAPVFRTL